MSTFQFDLPLHLDLFLYHSDTYTKGIRLRDENTGEYKDLTGAEILCQVRAAHSDTSIIFDFDVMTADQEDEDTVGLCYLTVTDADFQFIERFDEPVQIGVYDFQVTWPEENRVTYLEGDVYVKGDVSR